MTIAFSIGSPVIVSTGDTVRFADGIFGASADLTVSARLPIPRS